MFKNTFSTINKINGVLTGVQRKSIVGLLVLMLLSSVIETFGISVIIPYFAVLTDPDSFISGRLGSILSEAFNVSDQNEILILMTVALITAFGIKYLFTYVIRLRQTNFINRNRFAMAQRVMQYLIFEDYENYLYRNLTEEINLVTTHVTWTFELIGSSLSMMVQVLNVLLLSVFMLLVDIRITICFGVGILILYSLFDGIFKNKVKYAGEEANKTWEEYEKTIGESFLLKKENSVFRRNDKVYDAFCFWGSRNVKADEKKIKYGIIPGLIINLISVWAILFFVLFALASGNNIVGSLGKLSAFYLAVIRIVPGVNLILSNAQMVSFYMPSLDKVREILKCLDKTEHVRSLDYKSYPMMDSIKLNNVTFRYKNSDQNILERIDLKIKNGERIGIVGMTGSGKTTLVNLITGLIRPISGDIYIDDVQLSADCLLDVGYVPQDTNLVNSTIRNNITFGRTVDDSEIAAIVKASELQEFVEQLPLGLDTEIGEQGVRLSGGQRQRIGIARALVGSPSVLIFDEATSSLDPGTEKEIINTIKAIGGDKTVIMVSHRTNVLDFCDRWFSVKNHKLYELYECP